MQRRSLQLDVLRGIAILLVLFRHPAVLPSEAGRLARIARVLERFGWTGVDLFFVLSGFLIGGLLFNEIRQSGRLNVRRFLVRRGMKIWPAYFVFLGFAFSQGVWRFHSVADAIRPLIPNLVHLQNYIPTPLIHTWSLAVEEHFYLALPLLLLVLLRWGSVRWIPGVVAFVCVACFALRLTNLGKPFTFITHQFPTHLRADSLGFGVFLAYLRCFHPQVLQFQPRTRWLLLAAAIVLLAPLAVLDASHPFVWTIGYTLAYLGFGCVLLACVDADAGLLGRLLSGRMARAIALVGIVSYSTYLWHLSLRDALTGVTFTHYGALRWAVLMTVYFIGAGCIGWLGTLAIERPFLAIRDRWFPSRAGSPPQPSIIPPLEPMPAMPALSLDVLKP
jgi:peptidoglycan/LPS O-acetylase OafA/YrhL